ncbi:MAG: peptidoglycan-associated lipoprotein Pal [Pseudomonadota bacterium]
MKRVLSLAVLAIAPVLFLSACGGSNAVKEEAAAPAPKTPPPVETPKAQAPRAEEPAPVAKSATPSVHQLDDPSGLLAKRKIYFEYDSSEVQSEFRNVIAAHATYLSANASAAVILEGHCDERGTREYNMALGERRARAVMQALTLQGVNAKQITVVSYGEERPEDPGHSDSAWAKNRRAFISYTSR